MAETTADVRRDIEMTRERMSDTIAQLERKLNVAQVVRDHPWPAIALAVGAGVLLSGSGSDVKAAAATAAATKGASSKLGPALDDLVARLMTGVTAALNERVDHWVNELKVAIGAPAGGSGQASYGAQQGYGSQGAGQHMTEGMSQGGSQGGSQGYYTDAGYAGSGTSGAGYGAGAAPVNTAGTQAGGMNTGGTAGGTEAGGAWAPKYGDASRAD